MPRSWFPSALAVALVLAAAQAPRFRVTYGVRVLERAGTHTRLVATGEVSGPQETDLRLGLRTDSAEVEALLELVPEADTVTLAGNFFSRRRLGRSRRGLPLWEQDSYRRSARLGWGGTARIHPFGAPRPRDHRALWVEVAVARGYAGGETRPTEQVTVIDSSFVLTMEAVARPRRVRVILTMVRGDTASVPRHLDLIPEAPARPVRFVLGRRAARTLEVGLVRRDPPPTGRALALALDADVVCLRVTLPHTALPARVRCGRLNNVARRLPLPEGDTLVATFAWPGPR